jgi:outer membrane receptor for ferrienterochelin and colicins
MNHRPRPRRALPRRPPRQHPAWLLAFGTGLVLADTPPPPAPDAPKTLPAVVVSASRHAMPAADAPATISVVDRAEIEARGADTLLDAVRGTPGVLLQGRSIGGRQVLSLRGLDSRHSLFLVDGRRVAASDGVIGHSDFQYAWVDADAIERIEVVRGPMSVLYGSDALGGVLNVITREPGERWRVGAAATARRAEGDRGGDGHRANLQADGPLGDRLGLRAGVAQSQRDALASVDDPRLSELEGADRRDAWLGLVWRPAARHRLAADLSDGHEDRRADARERGGLRREHETVNRIDRRHGALAWDADWDGAAGLATQLRAYRSALDVRNERSAGVPANPEQRLDERVLDGQLHTRAGRHDWTLGFEARNEGLADPGLPGGRSVAQHRSLFAQDEFALAPDLRLTWGLRHDRHDRFGDETSPRIYLVWRIDPAWTLKGGASHGFKAPNLKQIVPGGRREGPNIVLGNADLRPERSDAVEAGIGWQQGARKVQAVLFAQRIEDLIDLRLVEAGPVPGTGTYAYENRARARLRGLETAVDWPLAAGFGAGLACTVLDARDDAGQRLTKRPRHSAALRLDWQHDAWRAGLRIEHQADQLLATAAVGAPPERAPSVTLVGAHLTRALPWGLELTLAVDNLTDVRLAERSPLFAQAEPPRTWRATLRGRW